MQSADPIGGKHRRPSRCCAGDILAFTNPYLFGFRYRANTSASRTFNVPQY